MTRPEDRTHSLTATARALVARWDEYLQGYDAAGNIVICICGRPFPPDDHRCPYDTPEPPEAA